LEYQIVTSYLNSVLSANAPEVHGLGRVAG
jgi:hypothetical protein